MSDVTTEIEEVSKPIVGKVSGMKPGVINGKYLMPLRAPKRSFSALKSTHLENHPGDSVSSLRAAHLRGVV